MSDQDLKRKGQMIDSIMFQCKLAKVGNDKFMPLDKIFIYLATCSIPALIGICHELHIKIPS